MIADPHDRHRQAALKHAAVVFARTALTLCVVAFLSACATATPPPAADVPVATIVVVHHQGELAPTLAQPDLDQLATDALTTDDDRSEVVVVAAGRPGNETVDILGRRPNGQPEHGPRRQKLVDERLQVLQEAVARAAREGSDGDVLRALDAAARSGARRLIVLTAGLSTVDPFDLRVAGFDQDPAALADGLLRARALPDLTGRQVVFSGLGRTEPPQPPLGVREQAWLRSVYVALCHAAGAASCAVDDGERAAAPSLSSIPDQVVPIPQTVTTPGPDGGQIVSVPSPLLFAPNSCTMIDRSAAVAVLAPIAQQLRRGGLVVSISGRTAPVGPGTGVDLATCRAHAAADVLHSGLGVPLSAIADVRGDGSLLDPPQASQDASGRLDPSKLPGLRRVVFTVTTVKGVHLV